MESFPKPRTCDYDMLYALYDYTATIPQTISFKTNDTFIFHSANNIKKNWWSVINSVGKVGYIPSNYVGIIKVLKERMIEFIASAIKHLRSDLLKEGKLDKQLELMEELISRKQEIIETKHKHGSSKEKLTCSKSLPNQGIQSDETNEKSEKESVSPSKMRISMSETKFPSQKSSTEKGAENSHDVGNIAPHSAYNLIQQVRNQTGLSHEESRIAVGIVVEGLLDIFPSVAAPSLDSFLELLQIDITPPGAILDDTVDARNLRHILTHLTNAREDAQQRSWHLWDDEATIKQNITQLSSILSNADPVISKRVLKSNSFEDVTMLVDYYQMEDRYTIRQLLLQAFAVMCSLDKVIISILLNSVLPMELAREMQSNINTKSKLSKPAMLLAMIFSLGEAMPITHLDQLGVDFIKIILEVIESERGTDIADKMLTLILSYNLQFKPKSPANIIIQAITEVTCPKTFSEKVLLLINREDDPIAHLKTHATPCHSVLKLLKDLFSYTSTADLFYTNDIKVLIDIIVRQVTDLPPKNKKRTEYLELCKLVMYNCDSLAFEHRLPDLKSVFHHITTDELPPVESDMSIVKEIILALPQHFDSLKIRIIQCLEILEYKNKSMDLIASASFCNNIFIDYYQSYLYYTYICVYSM